MDENYREHDPPPDVSPMIMMPNSLAYTGTRLPQEKEHLVVRKANLKSYCTSRSFSSMKPSRFVSYRKHSLLISPESALVMFM